MKSFEITKHLNRGGRARILALSLFILILSVFSCANDAAIDDFTNPAISDSAEKIVFSGRLNIEGAVPGALSKISNESEVTGRSAFPSLVTSETSDVKYYISARATGPEGISEEIKGSVDQTAKSYSIGLTIGRTYTLTASLKKTLTDGQQLTIMEDEWENVTPSRTNTSLTHDFILKPVEGGNGSIKLKMTLPTGIDCPSLSGDEIESTIQFHDDYTTATATISVDVIPAGTYNITINFYKSSRKFLLYSIPQTINVFAGMETNTWQDDGSSNSPISDGKFVLTDEIIKNYQRTIFYVSEKDFTGKEIPVGQTRTGSPYAPFASLSDALNTITNNNKAEDYKIFIGGSLTGNTQISTLIKAENAKSLIIEGFTGNSSDCLVGDGSSSVLTVESSVPLTIKNLRITGGNAEKGGGILIGDSAVVFLGNDLIVSGNEASALGGGVYAPNGVNVEGNLVITENTDSFGKASNLYLPAGKCVNVKGALTKGIEKAKIGISTADEPSLTNKIVFTLDYGKYNSSVAPGTYFTGDKWTVTAGSGTAAGEAVLAASGGNIIIEPVYEDIQISADKTSFTKDTASKVITFTAKGVNSEGQQVTLPIGTGEGKVSLTYSVSYHGETVTESFYEKDENEGTLTLGNSLPTGDYIVSITASYKDRTYSASFSVKITTEDPIASLESAPTEGTWSVNTQEAFEKIVEWANAKTLNSNVTYTLESDITLSNWTSATASGAFKGNLNGNGHKIIIESLQSGTTTVFGGSTDGATVKNLVIEGNVSGQYTGLFKRFQSSSVMENVVNKVNINYTGTGSCSGLFIDCGNSCTVINCRNEGNIYAPNATNVGGIYASGSATGISLIGCVNTGNITGKEKVGGICGVTWSSLRDCRNEGTITGEDIVGGIAGDNHISNSQNLGIHNCINNGTVRVTKNDGRAGGICGTIGSASGATFNYGNVQNCINIGSVEAVSVTSNYIGGIVGKKFTDCIVTNFKNNYYLTNGSLKGIGTETDESGICDCFTKSGSVCNVSNNLTVGAYTGKDVVQLMNAWVNANTLNFSELSTNPLKKWKYDASGNIGFDE